MSYRKIIFIVLLWSQPSMSAQRLSRFFADNFNMGKEAFVYAIKNFRAQRLAQEKAYQDALKKIASMTPEEQQQFLNHLRNSNRKKTMDDLLTIGAVIGPVAYIANTTPETPQEHRSFTDIFKSQGWRNFYYEDLINNE